MTRLAKYRLYFTNKKFLLSVLTSFFLLFVSLIVNFYAGSYATESASNSVTDIILSNIRTFDVDGIFVYGSVLLFVFITILCLIEPNRIPFVLKSISLFVLIRAVFISLTHIGPFPTEAHITSTLLDKFTFGGDLFFSGHTGIPFLMALIFWRDIYLRIIFITSSILFGIIVLLAHLHYSIDVLSAFFITYAIYRIAELLFKRDRETFLSGVGTTG